MAGLSRNGVSLEGDPLREFDHRKLGKAMRTSSDEGHFTRITRNRAASGAPHTQLRLGRTGRLVVVSFDFRLLQRDAYRSTAGDRLEEFHYGYDSRKAALLSGESYPCPFRSNAQREDYDTALCVTE